MASVRRVNKLRVGVIPESADCSELTPENAALFYTAVMFSEPVYSMVAKTFEETLKEEAGLDGKVKKAAEVELKKGDITFTLTATPSSSTSYQSICTRLEAYLGDIQQAANDGVRRQGVRTFEGSTYLSLSELKVKTEDLIAENTNPKTATKIDYTKMKDQSLDKLLDMVEVEPESCGEFTCENAKVYRIAKEQVKRINGKVVKPFQDSLKAETGYSKTNVPEETVRQIYQVGDYAFLVISAPRQETKYGEIVKQLKGMLDDAQEQVTAGKSEMPCLKVRDAEGFFEIGAFMKQYEALTEKNSRKIVEQQIITMPVPEYDRVIAK